ncbi:MAG: hypothetical protein HYZ73_05215 [Elusimicrobia bacterium]|nr:hypothetical protein [Elusimicrobiota bacterium]
MGQERFRTVYAPLRKLLLDIHITSWSSVRYPYFKMRLKRAFPYLKRGALGPFMKTLCDKGISASGSVVEYGSYPLDEIKTVVKEKFIYCDSKLVDLLQSALRLRLERHDEADDELEWADKALLDHICREYDRLARRVT